MLRAVNNAIAKGEVVSQVVLGARIGLANKQRSQQLLSSLVEKGKLDSTTPLGNVVAEKRRIREQGDYKDRVRKLVFDGWHPWDIADLHEVPMTEVRRAISELSAGRGSVKFRKALQRARKRRPLRAGIPKVIQALWLFQEGKPAEQAAMKLGFASHKSFLASLGVWRAQGIPIPSQREASKSRAKAARDVVAGKIASWIERGYSQARMASFMRKERSTFERLVRRLRSGGTLARTSRVKRPNRP